MALDAVGLQQPLAYTVDLKEGLVQKPMSSQLMKGDKKANRVIVHLTDGGKDAVLSGVTVTGSFIRPPDAAEVPLEGEAEENVASVILNDACYTQEGYCEIYVKLTVGGTARTILALTGYVRGKGSGAYVDVEGVIPNIDDIIAQYAEMKMVTQRAIDSAEYAESLAINAEGYADNTNKLGGREASEYALKAGQPYVTPQQFGAVADGVTDDSEAIQAAFDAGNCIVFPEGDYHFSGINCTHDVHVLFIGANLVPKHPTYDASASGGGSAEHYEHGVFENFFRFVDCDSVALEGLKMIRDEPATKRAEIYLKDENDEYVLVENDKQELVKVVNPAIPQTRSIAEFENCERVVLKDWHVRGLSLFNRGKTPGEFAERKGIIYTAVDTGMIVQGCVFENIQWDEWTYTVRRNDTYATKCTFDRCVFRSPFTKDFSPNASTGVNGNAPGLTCANVCFAAESIIQNCIFEDITYNGSLANGLGLLSIFRNNAIVGCNVGGVIDTREGSIGLLFANEVIIENNTMSDSTCGSFAKFGAKSAFVRNNNGVIAGQFVWAIPPHPNNIVREGTVSSMHTLIAGNEAVCTGKDTSDVNDAFVRINYNKTSGIWESEDGEVVIRQNRFSRTGSIYRHPGLVMGSVKSVIVHNNSLFYGTLHNSENYSFAMTLVPGNNTVQRFEFVGNVLDGDSVHTDAGNKSAVRTTGATLQTLDGCVAGNVLYPSATTQTFMNSASSNPAAKIEEGGNVGFVS